MTALSAQSQSPVDYGSMSTEELLRRRAQLTTQQAPTDYSSMSTDELMSRRNQLLQQRGRSNASTAPVGALESGARGLASGLLFNFDDEIYGAFAGADARENYRRRTTEAQAQHPLVYGAGQVGGAFAPVFMPLKALGMGVRGWQAAEAARAVGSRTLFNNPITRNLVPLAVGGAGYGALARIGAGEGGLDEASRYEGLTLGNAATDAAGGVAGGVLGGVASGAISRAMETAGLQRGAQRAFDNARQAAQTQFEAGASRANATARDAAIDASRQAASDLADNERLGAAQGAAAAFQQLARDVFGIELTRTQAAQDPRIRRWFADAMDGSLGPVARQKAEDIVSAQSTQARDAFMRVIDPTGNYATPTSATEAASTFRNDLLRRQDEERDWINAAEEALAPYASVEFKRSPRGREIGLETLRTPLLDAAREVDLLPDPTRLRGDSTIRNAEARRVMRAATNQPVARRLFEDITTELDVARANTGARFTIANLRQLRQLANRAWEDVNTATAAPTDRRAVARLRGALVEWEGQLLDEVGGISPSRVFAPGNRRVRDTIRDAAPDQEMPSDLPLEALRRLNQARSASAQHYAFFGAPGVDGTRAAQGARGSQRQAITDDIASIVSPAGTAKTALDQLIGANGISPRQGAHLTIREIKNRFGGDDAPEVRNLKAAVLARLTDQINLSQAQTNPHVFRSVYARLDGLLKNNPEFVRELFTDGERARLGQLRDIVAQLQTPGPAASGPSARAVAAATHTLFPGAQTVRQLFQDAIAAPIGALNETRLLNRPTIAGPTAKSALVGALIGPRSVAGTAAQAAAMAAPGATYQEPMTREEIDRILQENGLD